MASVGSVASSSTFATAVPGVAPSGPPTPAFRTPVAFYALDADRAGPRGRPPPAPFEDGQSLAVVEAAGPPVAGSSRTGNGNAESRFLVQLLAQQDVAQAPAPGAATQRRALAAYRGALSTAPTRSDAGPAILPGGRLPVTLEA